MLSIVQRHRHGSGIPVTRFVSPSRPKSSDRVRNTTGACVPRTYIALLDTFVDAYPGLPLNSRDAPSVCGEGQNGSNMRLSN